MSGGPVQGDRPEFRITAPATPIAVRGVLLAVDDFLSGLDCPAELSARLRIALSEVLNNIVEHACPGLAGAQMHVTITAKGDGLSVVVRDPGRPFPGGVLPEGRAADVDVSADDLPEGGFGWFLIRAVTDGLDHERRQGWTRLRLWFRPRPDEETFAG
jgi:serine/threonine-protein kinase RsbW